MQPRAAATGAFVPAPATGGDGFVEGTAAQYTWFVPQDVAGLVAALGGPDAARARLDAFFTQLNAGAASDHAFLGNEPTLLTPALYDWLGPPGGRRRHRAQGHVVALPSDARRLPRQRRRRPDVGLVGLRRARALAVGARHRRPDARQPAVPAHDDRARPRHGRHPRAARRPGRPYVKASRSTARP